MSLYSSKITFWLSWIEAGGFYRWDLPWRGDPRVNIQNSKGKAKAYQVRQVLKAIERLEVENGIKK